MSRGVALAAAFAAASLLAPATAARGQESAAAPPAETEAFFFTPPGFSKPGIPVWANAESSARLHIVVRDADRAEPTPCRMTVVGPDGNFFQPERDRLSPYALTGEWPKESAWGNRRDKAPYRYVGRFFYVAGEVEIAVPPGSIRIEVTKGLEYRPVVRAVSVEAGERKEVEIAIGRTAAMRPLGWHSGDPHLHVPRSSDEDDARIFDLLEAEDIRYGSLLGYNEPAGPYAGFMDKFAAPQFQGLGRRSERERAAYRIMSGQEYRTSTYGHLLLYHRDDIVFPGASFDANRWPVYGLVARQTRELGGFAFYAHGGYRQEIYADAALGVVDGVELLQFGVYREMGLEDWYHVLNTGYRFPCMGASDWPACRTLGDCRTYVRSETDPDFPGWLAAMAAGKSFVTTGPLVLLDAEGNGPGDIVRWPADGARPLAVTIKVACEVTPVRQVDLIVNGIVAKSFPFSSPDGADRDGSSDRAAPWREFRATVPITESSWVAARAWSTTAGGRPDAEAHTNPIYVQLGDQAPYRRESLDAWIARIDEQIAKQKARDFPEKPRVLDYFQLARDTLLGIRERGGLRADERPADLSSEWFSGAAEPRLERDAAMAEPSGEQLTAFLKRVPAKTPDDAIRAFDLVPGLEMRLVAAEPLVCDPVAAAFDADGNLYVCEMRDYPFKPADGAAPRGTVRWLRDMDGDGSIDHATVFADGLLWAAGVAPWKGGVFVAAAPDLWYLKDHDGDGVADERRRLFTGFGTDNQQAMVNNLAWGPDHKIYGSTAGNGGRVRRADLADAPEIDISGRDFRFDPETLELELITGTVQFGNTFDDWGNRFVCSESQPLQQIVLPREYLTRNPWLVAPAAIHNAARGPVPIHRISPIERWRRIRSARRIAKNERSADAPGASHHVIDAAAGVTIYRGGALPPQYDGTVFVGDGQNNLIHHRRLVGNGVTFGSERTFEGTEIVRSSDIWFRPVNFVNAPDGTLYCLDMSREVLESIHIPLDVAEHLDFSSGRDRGRIYQLAPARFRSPPPPRLENAPTDALVDALASPHGWWRDTAHRLLRERRDASCAERLRAIVRSSDPTTAARTRLLALGSLEGLGCMAAEDLLAGLGDASPGVRARALRLAERRLDRSPAVLDAVLCSIEDADARVRFQAAFTLGESSDPRAAHALCTLLAKHGADPWLRTAALSSAVPHAVPLFDELLRREDWVDLESADAVLPTLAHLVGAVATEREWATAAGSIFECPRYRNDAGRLRSMVVALGRGIRQSGSDPGLALAEFGGDPERMLGLLRDARLDALDRSKPEAIRRGAIDVLELDAFAHSSEAYAALLDVATPPELRNAVIRSLALRTEPEAAEVIVQGWSTYTPDLRAEAIDGLLTGDTSLRLFLDVLERGGASPSEVDATWRQRLARHADSAIRARAKRLWGDPSGSPRAEVVARYQAVLPSMRGDVERGRRVFADTCAACHRLDGQGVAVGPDILPTAVQDRDVLLTHVLDPNRYVPPQFVQVTVVDQRGRVLGGMIAAQDDHSISIVRERDQRDTVRRADVESITATGQSLMPEGLERMIPPESMADLVAYLQTASTHSPADRRKERDFGTLPGLVERPSPP